MPSPQATIELIRRVIAADAASGAGTPAAGITAAESGSGANHQTVLTLDAFSITVANTTGASFGGAKLYDFPLGRIQITGVVASLSFNWAGTDIVETGSGDFSMGTTITADATLSGTDVDLCPSSAMSDPAVAGVATGSGQLATPAQFDGTVTAKDANLNLITDDADNENGDTDPVLVSGTITLTWAQLGTV